MPDQTPDPAAATRVSLEDLIEAVSRGVTRAMLAEDDEVSGYILKTGATAPVGGLGTLGNRPPIFVGLWIDPTTRPGGVAAVGAQDLTARG